MNERIPNWSAWQTPPPDPYFDQRVFQKLEAARHAHPTSAPWWESWALAGALAGATALLMVSLAYEPASSAPAFGPVGTTSLTHAYASTLKGN
jgi:hypothetical protein